MVVLVVELEVEAVAVVEVVEVVEVVDVVVLEVVMLGAPKTISVRSCAVAVPVVFLHWISMSSAAPTPAIYALVAIGIEESGMESSCTG